MEPIKVGFVLLSNSANPLPSTRIAALNIFALLQKENFAPKIVFEPETNSEMPDVSGLAPSLLAKEFDVIVFQKVHGPSVEKLTLELSAAGVKTVYLVCDLIDVDMANATDLTIVVSDYLKNLYPKYFHPKIQVVHDGIEEPSACKTRWTTHRGSNKNPLKAVLVTSRDLDSLPILKTPPDWLQVTIVGRYAPATRPLLGLRHIGWKLRSQRSTRERMKYLRFIADGRIRRVAWDEIGVYQTMREADIGIIPIETAINTDVDGRPPGWKVKSENRLTMKMSLGLPVIATPIPAYESVVTPGYDAFFARTEQEWKDCLEALRDPAFRRAVGERARVSVGDRYSMRAQAERFVAVLTALLVSSADIALSLGTTTF